MNTNSISHVKVGYQGVKEWLPTSRITFINGINCNYNKALDLASIISTYHRYNKIHFVCDETQGLANDFLDSASLLVLNHSSEAVIKLTELWCNLFKEMDEPNHPDCQVTAFAWSRGGLVTKLALEKLPDHLRAKMVVYTFGTPAIINSGKEKKVVQFDNTGDYISLTNPMRWVNELGVAYKNDVNLVSKKTKAGLDHNIVGPTYLREIKEIGKVYYPKAS